MPILDHKQLVKHVKSHLLRAPGKSIYYAIFTVFTLVAVIVLSVGHISLESRAIYSEHSALSDTSSALTAMTVAALVQIGNPGVHGRPRVRVLANTSIVVLQPEILGKKPHPAPGN